MLIVYDIFSISISPSNYRKKYNNFALTTMLISLTNDFLELIENDDDKFVPGGNEEQPVVNCKNDFRSSPVISHKTSTNNKNPGLSFVKPNLGSV